MIISLGKPWYGQLFFKYENLSHASLIDSRSNYWNEIISLKTFNVLEGGKYLVRKNLAKSSHVVKEPGGCDFNHIFALSFNMKENKHNFNALSVTQFDLHVLQISKNLAI